MPAPDSNEVEIPEPLLFLAAIEDIGFRYGLTPEVDERILKAALRLISDQAKLAMTLLNVPDHEKKRLAAEWDAKRVDVGTPRYLRDPMLLVLSEFVKGLRVSIKDLWPIPGSKTEFHFDFEYHCEECGGYEIHIPEPREDHSMVTCGACGKPFGTYLAVTELCKWIGREKLRVEKLGAFAQPGFELTVHGVRP